MRNEAGYATPTAMVFSLALALVSSALVERSVTAVRHARADLDRQAVEYALDGAQLDAASQVIRSGPGGPYHWSFSSDAGWLDAVAEREVDKVDLAHAATLPDAVFAAFGVTDVAALKGRLATAASTGGQGSIGDLDAAPLWRRCAASVFSNFGGTATPHPITRQAPHTGDPTPAWRVAELWRVSLTAPTGWRDDRLVRFTGDALHPAAVVSRRFQRSNGGEGQCDATLADIA